MCRDPSGVAVESPEIRKKKMRKITGNKQIVIIWVRYLGELFLKRGPPFPCLSVAPHRQCSDLTSSVEGDRFLSVTVLVVVAVSFDYGTLWP